MAQGGGDQVNGEKIWLDGRLVDWADGNVHLLTHTLHYGLGVFEGIRCYRTEDGRSAVFRLPEHVARYEARRSSPGLDLHVYRSPDLAMAVQRPGGRLGDEPGIVAAAPLVFAAVILQPSPGVVAAARPPGRRARRPPP